MKLLCGPRRMADSAFPESKRYIAAKLDRG
jgi:hypothetical protein